MELQGVQAELAAQGIGLLAVSYDPPEVLREFAEAKGISYPLLSDQGSRVITELGLLDRDLEAHHARFGVQLQEHQLGVAYPSVFVLDEQGKVQAKRIKEHYRTREGAAKLLEEALGLSRPPAGPSQSAAGPKLRVTAVSDAARYVRWQESRLHLLFELEPGWHVYGRPLPAGYAPLEVAPASIDEVRFGAPGYPPTKPFRVQGLDEDFNVYAGRFEVGLPFAVEVGPDHGPVGIEIGIRYQACSQEECLPPAAATLSFTLEQEPPA